MRVAVQTIIELSIEQKESGVEWVHPWDHYPFFLDGQQVWKRYQDLTPEQMHLLTQALDAIRSAQEQNDDKSYTTEHLEKRSSI
jgi:hypothetical protein